MNLKSKKNNNNNKAKMDNYNVAVVPEKSENA